MCGIFGVVGPQGADEPLSESQAIQLRDLMSARGPDGAGLFMRKPIAFAHRRLAIRDPHSGQQPWINPEQSIAVVFNGEIYNDRELRVRLERHGFSFRTRCDTELIPAAYSVWGLDFMSHLRGDFAIGLYDFSQSRLLLVRDRCGAKPLFYTTFDDRLVFASTINVLRHHPGFSAQPNWRTISHYLTTLRLTLGSQTMFQNINTLEPGELLIYEQRQVRIIRYWNPPLEEEREDFDAAVDAFESRLREAVSIRLAGDVPAGLFLSGGVDSTTLACIAGEERSSLPAGCGTGVARVEDSGDDHFAEIAAGRAGCDLQQVKVDSEDYRNAWLQLLDAYDTPVSTPTDAILFRLSESMKRSAGFVLGGEGADELLCGYSVQHRAGHDYDRWREFDCGQWQPSPHVASLFRESLKRGYQRSRFHSLADHYFALNSLIPSQVKSQLLNANIWQSLDDDQPMIAWYEQQLGQQHETTASEKTLRLLHRANLESLLSRLDNASMQAGLEVRPVFADHLLVEETFRLPESFKIDVTADEPAPFLSATDLAARGSLRNKRLLRASAERMMPSTLAHRPKASFPTPVHTWLGTTWSDWVRQTLQESEFASMFLSPPARDALAMNPSQAGMWLWPIMNVVLWGERQFCAAS